MEISRLYWRHSQTGEIYAVHINVEGVIDGAAGPISTKEATSANLVRWQYSPAIGEQLRRRLLEFDRLTLIQKVYRRKREK